MIRRFKDEHGVVWDALTILSPRPPVLPQLEDGWVTFRSRSEVRRITPGVVLDTLSHAELRSLLSKARRLGTPLSSAETLRSAGRTAE